MSRRALGRLSTTIIVVTAACERKLISPAATTRSIRVIADKYTHLRAVARVPVARFKAAC